MNEPFSPIPTDPRPVASLLSSVPSAELRGDGDLRVLDATHRSDSVRRGTLFFCVPGAHVDGHDFAAAACRQGAVGVVVDHWMDVSCAQILVPSVREAMGPMSAEVFGRPSEGITVIGVTGTNGKTTTTYLLESIFRVAGWRPGVIGTTGVRIDGAPLPFDRTTPEAPDLHRLFARMAKQGVNAIAMEVSSHGLDQHRVDGTRYSCSVFTNLSQDHLDYHPTMEAYFDAKARLFTPGLSARGVVNFDSSEGLALVERATIPTLTFGLGEGAAFRATDLEASASGTTFTVEGTRVRSSLRGTFNVYNCLGAIAAAREVGVEVSVAADGVALLGGVPGRLEAVEGGQPFALLVDYAHTPDSLENVLVATRDLSERELIVVFGCGGDRDRAKRPLMGESATRLADFTVITSDNPRSEDPDAIISEIAEGARRGGGGFEIQTDRRLAIRSALSRAGEGDVVLIAGKGHETGQEFSDRTVPFDDRVVAREELKGLMGESPR